MTSMKVTVVSICLNNKDGLQKTIESVINQTAFNEIEYLIIDGGSTDGSVEIIEQYKDYLDYWISEPDDGIFPAMNKAIEHINGEYTLYLNSGDYLCENNVIENVIPLLDKDIVYGNEYKVGKKKLLATFPDRLDEGFFKRGALPHQSTLIASKLLKQHNYSTDWKILGDWLWFRQRVMVDKVSYKHLNFPISVYNLEGLSSVHQDIFKAERKKYYNENGVIYSAIFEAV